MTDTPKREPMMSDASITVLAKSSYDYTLCWLAMEKARTHYENLIDTGVLVVAKTVKRIPHEGSENCCSNCYAWIGGGPNFCSDCGLRIVE